MDSMIGLRALGIIGLLCVCGCLAPISRAVEETRVGLLGLDGRDLRRCLGVPSDFEIEGDVERQTYRFERDDPYDRAFGAGDIGGDVAGRRLPDGGRDATHGFPLDDRDPSFCQLDFELAKGRVTRVVAQGRTREGMNSDAGCMLRARRCLPWADEDPIDDLE